MWAETGDAMKDQRRRRVNAAILRRKFRRGGDTNLGFLRVCKLVNFEASEIFYGKNKFRFSGTNGCMAAYAYVTKIGSRNLDFVKNVSVAAPFTSSDRGWYGENWNPSGWMRVHEVYDRMAFPFPARTPEQRWRYPRLNFKDAWCMLAWKLTTAQSLDAINIVIADPSEYNDYCGIKPHEQAWSAFEDLTTAKPFLEFHVTIVKEAGSDPTLLKGSYKYIIAMLKNLAVCRVHLAEFGHDEEGPDGRWKLAPQPYVDKRGCFTMDQDSDRSVEVVDILPDMERLFEGKWPKA